MKWPEDADGDVLRRLESRGFDFSQEYDIDFNVDFDVWPPPEKALALLQLEYDIVIIEPQKDTSTGMEFSGYVSFQRRARLTYELVIRTQADVTEKMRPFQGRCDSWGLLHDS